MDLFRLGLGVISIIGGVSALNRGLYILQISVNGNLATRKILLN